jgi:hypothetical protein
MCRDFLSLCIYVLEQDTFQSCSLRRKLHIMRLSDSPLCRCGAEEETSALILCECEALASLSHAYLGSFFLQTEGIKIIILGSIWKFSEATALL